MKPLRQGLGGKMDDVTPKPPWLGCTSQHTMNGLFPPPPPLPNHHHHSLFVIPSPLIQNPPRSLLCHSVTGSFFRPENLIRNLPRSLLRHPRPPLFVTLAKAGIHGVRIIFWIPTFVGMTAFVSISRSLYSSSPLPIFVIPAKAGIHDDRALHTRHTMDSQSSWQ